MNASRRTLLAILPALMATPARADPVATFCAAQEHETQGRIGVHARNIATGRSLSWRANERFVMCSTFKLSLVACVLARVDQGKEQLARSIRYDAANLDSYAPVARQNLPNGGMTVQAMCQAAIEVSDNTCTNLLLASIGGPAALTRFWRSGGDTVTRLDHNEPLLNRSPPGDPHDTTTPAAMTDNLRRFVFADVLSPASRPALTGWMINCQTGAALLRAGLPRAWKVADKTGNNGRDAQGDIAVAWAQPDRPILISAYTQGGNPTAEQLRSILAGVGQLVATHLA